MQAKLWDIFCRVIDNFGDIGVCWRLAADLASRGERVRLWVDDASSLSWLAPHGAPGVTVRAWGDAEDEPSPGDVVIEAFGCELPTPFVQRLAETQTAPVWVNLEYLSAESYVERCHGLRSPQRNGLNKWFFYPGFTPRTGGLIREPGLTERLDALDTTAWLARHGITRANGERLVTLFCYDNPALPALIDTLSTQPTLLLLAGTPAQRQTEALLGPTLRQGELRAQTLAPMPQTEFDELLRCSDLNFVRGEDSFVRAQWAARPFVWQIYPQDDNAHAAKLGAFLDGFLAGSPPALAGELRQLFAQWNGLIPATPLTLPSTSGAWLQQTQAWRNDLVRQPDLCTQLHQFVTEKGNEAE